MVSIFRDERGITTTAMAVSILVSLALIFTGAQAYKVTSASTEIQEVADVCALAAESEVADFMVCVKVCDATVLSLGLLAGTVLGLGVVCACVPTLQGVASTLTNIGNKAMKARSSFAKNAAKGLNALQKALPFLAAASASAVASANNEGAMHADYFGCAILLPQQGEKISVEGADDLENAASDISDELSDIQERASEAEEAAKEAQEAKETAYNLDCGNNPGYCQYERAARFDWMPSSENPLYSNVDAWSFSVALDRARSYYAYREGRETEPNGSVQDKASYYVRMKFYSYAYEKLETEGYVNDNASSFSANFPKLYRNTSEFRQTSLYTSASFPVSSAEGDEKGVMHAWPGCPAAGNISSYDCVAALDSNLYTGCPTCNFSVESLGNVASASTNISNGFEYHYERIRHAAEQYQESIAKARPLAQEVKDLAQPLLDSLGEALKGLGGQRISANPCGSIGAVAIVVNKADNASDSGFENLFVSSPRTLGTRVAVSGAALVEDTSDDTSDVINSLLDGFSRDGGSSLGGVQIALDCWSGLLKAYENGQKSLEGALSSAISNLSLGTLTGLGEWASGALKSVIENVGLEPANLNALKPAILNTGHLVESSNDVFAVKYAKVRSRALSASNSEGTLFPSLSTWIFGALNEVSGEKITVAQIEFPVGGSKIPISISIPDSVVDIAKGSIDSGIEQLEELSGIGNREKVWQ